VLGVGALKRVLRARGRPVTRLANGFTAQLLEFAGEGREHRPRIYGTCVGICAPRSFPRDGLVRHSVPISTARTAAVSTTAAASALLEAVRAIHGLVATRLERNLGFFATTRTRGAEHFALAAAARTMTAAPAIMTTTHNCRRIRHRAVPYGRRDNPRSG
jgi:hypothetical protein